MTIHNCNHEDLIVDMKRDLYGNGRSGLKDSVIALKIQIKFVMFGVAGTIGLLIKLIWFGG